MSTSEEPTVPAKLIQACTDVVARGEVPSETPDVLYHLTNLEGLEGILTKKTLWASLATALNDSSEVQHGLGIAESILQDRLRRRVTEYDHSLLGFILDPGLAPPEVRYEFFPLVVSFCRRCDRAGQWLHYGRSGRGVAIGLSPEIAKAVEYTVQPVDYSIESQRTRMLHLIDVGENALNQDKTERPITGHQQIARRTAHIVSLFIRLLAARMKHPSFVEEEEWRFLAYVFTCNGKNVGGVGSPRPLLFRRSGETLVPYDAIPFKQTVDAVREVVVGFSAAVAPEAVRLLLIESGLNASVRRSEVPVR